MCRSAVKPSRRALPTDKASGQSLSETGTEARTESYHCCGPRMIGGKEESMPVEEFDQASVVAASL